MKIYEKPDVEFVSLVAEEEIAASLSDIVEGATGWMSFSIFG